MIDHLRMVIDMNESRLETIEQIAEFLAGNSELAFSVPSDESKLRAFVAGILKRRLPAGSGQLPGQAILSVTGHSEYPA